MFASVMLFFLLLAATVLSRGSAEFADIPFTETVQAPPQDGWELRLDRFHYWVIASLVLIVAVYGPFLMHHMPPVLSARAFTKY